MTDKQPERDEGLVGHLTRVHDDCQSAGVNERPVAPQIEEVVKSVRALRTAEDAAGLNTKSRNVIADAIRGRMD